MKTRYRGLALPGLLALGVLIGVPSWGPGQQEPADSKTGGDSKRQAPFDGKVISIEQRSTSDDSGYTLKDVTMDQIGDQQFLVGTGAGTGIEGDWTDGLRIWVAIEDVASIVQFESIEQYRETITAQ